MIIPFLMLEPETLRRLLEDFVTRDGTDNGDESSLEERVELARSAIELGNAVIIFDAVNERCQLMLRRDVPRDLLEQ